MKKYLTLIVIVAGWLTLVGSAHAANYTYYRAITVTSTTSVASGTLTNYPMAFTGTYTWLESTSTAGGAGRIQNLVTAPNGGQEAADLIFATSTPEDIGGSFNCGASLNFETEQYTSSTGVVSDWINVPSEVAGTVIYACYGNSSVTTDQSHASSTWNSNFVLSYHGNAPTGTLSTLDSTANAFNFTNTGTVVSTTAQIDGGYSTGAAGDLNLASNQTTLQIKNNLTMSEWFNLASGLANSIPSLLDNQFQSGAFVGVGLGLGNAGCANSSSSVSFIMGNGVSTNVLCSLTTVVGSVWHKVDLTFASGAVSLYLDGTLNTSTANIGTTTIAYGAAQPFYLGRNFAATFLAQKGDQVEIEKVAQTSQWILTSYNNENSPSTFYTVGAEQTAPSAGLNGTADFFIIGIIKIIGQLFIR